MESALKMTVFNLTGDADAPQFSANDFHASLQGILYSLPVEYKIFSSSFSEENKRILFPHGSYSG